MSDTSGTGIPPAEGALAPAAAQTQAAGDAQPKAAPTEPAAPPAQTQAANGGAARAQGGGGTGGNAKGAGRDGPSDADMGPSMSCCAIAKLAAFLFALYGVLIYLEVGLWRGVGSDLAATKNLWIRLIWIKSWSVDGDSWMLVMVVITGALGSFVHTATSLADFVGRRRDKASWVLWYLLRPFIGSALAVALYFVLRGGLLGGSQAATVPNPYGFAAVAVMAGMFAKQATDKLNEVFDNLFRTAPGGGDAARGDQLVPTTPQIVSLTPNTLQNGSHSLTVAVDGNHFDKGTKARVNGRDRITTFTSDTHLTFTLLADDVTAAGTLQVTVVSSAPGGGASNAMPLTIT